MRRILPILALLSLAAFGCSKSEFSSGTKKGSSNSGSGSARATPNGPTDLSKEYPDFADGSKTGPAANPDGAWDNGPWKDPNNPWGEPFDPNNPWSDSFKPGGDNSAPGSSSGGSNPSGGPTDPGPWGTPQDQANPPKSGPSETPTEVEFRANCDDATNPVNPVFDVEKPANQKVTAKLSGEFCPASASAELRVLFVVDFSASMGRHDMPQTGQMDKKGNDPVLNGTCGRYEAVKTILEMIKSKAKSTTKIEVGMIPFSSGVVTPYQVKPIAFEQFMTQNVSVEHICRFVLQSNTKYNTEPGATPNVPGSYDASTRYEQPLTLAKDWLLEKKLNTILYFITDGEPTDAGSGKAAAQALAQVPNLTANSLLLSHEAANARAVLEELTPGHDPDRVKEVKDASMLKVVIEQFEDPELNVNDAGAILKIAPYPSTEIGLVPLASGQKLEKVAGNRYKYVVQPFTLLGRPGETVNNFVEVWAMGMDGKRYMVMAQIRYKMTP